MNQRPGRDGQCSTDPPCSLSESGFRLYDMVDVFANDGWWFGFISGKIGEEYYVYFPTTADNIAYPRDVLRFHQEWSNGKWIFLPMEHFYLYNNRLLYIF